MMAARRIARCPSCSVSLLNSFFGVQLRLPARRTVTVLRVSAEATVVPRRAFQTGLARRSDRGRVGEEVGVGVGGVVEVESSVEVIEEEEFTLSAETGVGPAQEISQQAVKARTEVIDVDIEVYSREVAEQIVEEELVEEEEEGEGEELSLSAETETPPPSELPWFLRVETPRPASHPFALRQTLPPLPADSPPALSPLLTHLSDELGITDLALIDLRSMDPPPAIGTDTIMILGNARSERHLHISADKTCRWLRSTWKMTPRADGLLGRGEIKIKNRRLRKRGKLVNAQTGVVEGVGWICVDVRSQGLVVQLFTKGRREEIDLEGLWGKYVNKGAAVVRAVSIEDMFGKKPEEEQEDADAEVRYTPPTPPAPTHPEPVIRFGAGVSPGRFSQRRSLHTMPHRDVAAPPLGNWFSKFKTRADGFIFKGYDMRLGAERGQYYEITKRLPASYNPQTHTTLSNLILHAQINYLRISYPGPNGAGSRTGPCTFLGDGPADTTSTDFLRTFHANLASPQPTEEKLHYHLEFLIESHRLQPSVYPMDCLFTHLNTMVTTGIPPPPESYYLVLRALSTTPQLRYPRLPWDQHSTAVLTAMNAVTTHMQTHCPRPDTSIPEIQHCFFLALAPQHLEKCHTTAMSICSQRLFKRNDSVDHTLRKYPYLRVGTYTLSPALLAIDKALTKAGHRYTLREYQEMLLTAYAMGGAWVAFWNRWKSLRYMGVHRDAGFYSLVIGLLVMGRNQRECVNAVGWLVEDMVREVPGVGLTAGMARGMLWLLEIAERGEQEKREGEGGMDTYRELRKRCEGVVGRVWRSEEEKKRREEERLEEKQKQRA